MNMSRPDMLKDTLYYLSPESGVNEERAAGSLIGAVAMLMTLGYTFEEAIATVAPHLPGDYRQSCVPESWRTELRKHK